MPVIASDIFIAVYWVYSLMLPHRQLSDLSKTAKNSSISFIKCLW